MGRRVWLGALHDPPGVLREPRYDRARGLADRLLLGPGGHGVDHVALEVDDAALPRGAGEELSHGAHDAAVGVGGHALDPVQAVPAQLPQESLPAAVALGVDAGEADDTAARGAGGVDPRVGVALRGQLPVSQRGDLGVELPADPAHVMVSPMLV